MNTEQLDSIILHAQEVHTLKKFGGAPCKADSLFLLELFKKLYLERVKIENVSWSSFGGSTQLQFDIFYRQIKCSYIWTLPKLTGSNDGFYTCDTTEREWLVSGNLHGTNNKKDGATYNYKMTIDICNPKLLELLTLMIQEPLEFYANVIVKESPLP